MVSYWPCGRADMQVIHYSSDDDKEIKCEDFNVGLSGSGQELMLMVKNVEVYILLRCASTLRSN